MTATEQQLEGSLAQGSRRRPVVSQAQLVCVCVVIGIGAVITGAPALVQGPVTLKCASQVRRSIDAPATVGPPVPPPPSMPKRLQLPWQPVLTKEELRRGQTYYGSGARLQRVARKLLAGQPITVYALGGSITGGGGASPGHGFVELFFQFIRASFPETEHVLKNKAIAASTAFIYATCLQHHVPQDVDLVTLEFTVNERSEAPFTSPERRSFEQLLRKLLAYPSQPAVVVVHHYAWWEAPGDGVDRGLFYHEPEGQLTTLAHYYDVPTVSIRAAAYQLMAANIDHWRVDFVPMAGRAHYFVADNGSTVLGEIPVPPKGQPQHDFFLVDGMHPADHGHHALAELLSQPLIRAVWEVQAGDAVTDADRRKDERLQGLPAPMIPSNADTSSGFCAMMEDFKSVVKNSSGFEYAPERPEAADFMHQKWGWRGTEPGAWAELELDTRAAEGDGRDTIVWLAHLRSYQGMGTAAIECVSGCACEPTKLDGTWKRRASLFWMTRFLASRHARCRVRVTITDEPGEVPEEGHKVTLVAVMVAHLDLSQSGTLANVQELQNVRKRKKQ